MNPALFQLCAEFPHGALPEVFGIITVADPPDLRGEQGLPGPILGGALQVKGWQHYPAEVALPGATEPRVSFAIVQNLAKLERLAREFIRPEIFWVQRGEVIRMSADKKSRPERLGSWDHLCGRPPVELHASGNLSLLDLPATAFFCSSECPGEKILQAHQWARHQCDTGGTVISGFHTPVEEGVLDILAGRGANIIWVPGRDLPMTISAAFKKPTDENRLLILSPFHYGKPSRPSKLSCSLRNRFILGRTAHHFIPHAATGSSLASDIANIPL